METLVHSDALVLKSMMNRTCSVFPAYGRILAVGSPPFLIVIDSVTDSKYAGQDIMETRPQVGDTRALVLLVTEAKLYTRAHEHQLV